MIEPRYLVDLIDAIHKTNVHVVEEPYDIKDYEKISRFVNKDYKWKMGLLHP